MTLSQLFKNPASDRTLHSQACRALAILLNTVQEPVDR
jgi:hypothetical protein